MITTKHMTMEAELIRWLLLVVAAVALVLAVATLLAAMPTEPGLLPADMGRVAQPLAAVERPFFPETPPAREFPPAEAAARLWMVLEHQRAGCVAEALAGWEPLMLPDEVAHWREIAMGAAWLQAGDHQRAVVHLDAARRLAPDNAVLAYYMGILRLEHAAAVGRDPKPMNGENRFMVAAFTPQERGTFETMAMQELQQATMWAGTIRLDERLIHTDAEIEETVIVPRVGDLLVALQADNFVGKAHHLLFALHLDRRELIEAELNLDMAAATGLQTLYGYQDLAEAYLDADRQADGMRVLNKDLHTNHPWVGRACDRLADLTYGVARGMWVW
jgi:hypothetical protein